MFKYMDFIIYCLEEYRCARKLTGRQVITIFNKYNVYGFIENSYDALHTYDGEEIVWNINEYVRHKGSAYARAAAEGKA